MNGKIIRISSCDVTRDFRITLDVSNIEFYKEDFKLSIDDELKIERKESD